MKQMPFWYSGSLRIASLFGLIDDDSDGTNYTTTVQYIAVSLL